MPKKKSSLCKYGHDITLVGRQGSCCSECRRIKTRAYYHSHKETVLKQSLEHKRLKRYGLTPTEHNSLIEKQGNRCAICLASPITRQLSIDHNHRTNEVRGLLCGKCNAMLGMANDDPSILQALVS